jgi:peptidoglycan/LPS O-acetylase OafA/YrhL
MTQSAAHQRMTWLDANRVFAALGVILVHATSAVDGQPYTDLQPAQRVGPILLRWFSEYSGAELFLVFSLFLLAFKLDRQPSSYGKTVASQASRLLIPFAAWAVFYAFFRLFKASVFGYAPAIEHELAQWPNWIAYFLLGSSQYHLHFMPTLFALVLMYPLFIAAYRFPVAGFSIVPLLFVLDQVQGYIWGHVTEPMLRDYLLRAVKIITYGGYGLAAFSFYGMFKKGMSETDWRLTRRLAIGGIVVAFMTLLTNTYDVITTGQWGVRDSAANYGHFLMPLFVFVGFMASQNLRWSPRFSVLAKYTYGVYLTHPIFIDIWDAGVKTSGLVMDPTSQTVAKFVIGAAGGLGLTFALSRVGALAWLVGLGALPFSRGSASRAGGAKDPAVAKPLAA